MSARRTLDIALAVAVWTAGFLVLRRFGTWLPLTCGAVSLAALFLASDPLLRAEVWGNTGWPRRAGLPLLFAALMIGATYAGYALLAPRVPGLSAETRALYALLKPDRTPRLWTVPLLSLTAAAEEIIFRGRLMPRWGSPLARSLVASLIYAGAHVATGSFLLPLVAFGCGFAWGLIRAYCGSVTASIVVHVAWDLCVLVIAPL